MRSFSIVVLILFLLFYVFISIGAYKNLIFITPKNKRKIRAICLSTNIFIFLGFIILYIYPFQANKAFNYPLYFYFNAILFTDFFIKIPLALSLMIYYLFKRITGNRKYLFYGAIISIGIGLVICYGVFFGQHALRVNKVEIEFDRLPAEFQNFQIIQISDIHLGSYLKTNKVLKKTAIAINELKPDILLFTGDLVNNYSSEVSGWEETFKDITSSASSYSILGNHDYGDYTKWETPKDKQNNFEALLNKQQEIGFQLLRNENVIIKKGKDSIYLAGVENWGHPPFPQYADLEKAMKNISEKSFTILMTHDPAHWESKVKYIEQIDLVFSGHTHGLQWGIKPAGIPMSLAFLTRINWGGIYRFKNSNLVVNTGLGTIGIPWRIDMPPELTLVTLKRRKIN